MKATLLAAAVAVATFATPALADFWIVREGPTGPCRIVDVRPTVRHEVGRAALVGHECDPLWRFVEALESVVHLVRNELVRDWPDRPARELALVVEQRSEHGRVLRDNVYGTQEGDGGDVTIDCSGAVSIGGNVDASGNGEFAFGGFIDVTGSSIRRVEAEGALPVTIVTKDDIARIGATNTEQLLQSVSAISTMEATQLATGAGLPSYGEANISLRGLGAQRTLVLVNGRRLVEFAGSFVGGTVNVNSIPISAIERSRSSAEPSFRNLVVMPAYGPNSSSWRSPIQRVSRCGTDIGGAPVSAIP